MANYDLRILLETVEGVKTSYIAVSGSFGVKGNPLPITASFVNTSYDGLVLSSSQVYNRITGSVSCSYQNSTEFSRSVVLSPTDVNSNFTFKDNSLLSASLNGGFESGSIEFYSTDTEYDRLLRYKFIGEKVCHVLGLPSSQWIYVDQVRFPADDESNYIQGNLNARSINVSDKITFANTSNMNSDITFLIDTGSDRHIKFVDTSNLFQNALMMGYDVDADRYEMSASLDKTFHIKNVDKIDSSAGAGCQIDYGIGSIQGNLARIGATNVSSRTLFQNGDMYLETGQRISVHDGTTGEIGTINTKVSVTLLDSDLAGNSNKAPITFRAGDADEVMVMSQSKVGINVDTSDPITHELTVIGDISASGNIYANEYHTRVVSSSIIHSEGSTIFGDSSDDTHTFQGNITASGDISASGTITAEDLIVKDNATVAGDLDVADTIYHTGDSNTKIRFPSNDTISFHTSGNEQMVISSGGHITASGDISASGHIYVGPTKNLYLNQVEDTYIDSDATDRLRFVAGGQQMFVLDYDTGNRAAFGDTKVGIGAGDNFLPTADLHVAGNVWVSGSNGHITASGNISGSITSNLTMGGNIIAKTYKSEKLWSYLLSGQTDGTEYFFPVGSHYDQTVQGSANTNPQAFFTNTAMCDLSIKRLKIQFPVQCVIASGDNFKIYCKRWDGGGSLDAAADWENVGTAWTVKEDSNITVDERFFHAPSDWNINAGEIWTLAWEINGISSVVVIFSGGVVIEENWNTLISS